MRRKRLRVDRQCKSKGGVPVGRNKSNNGNGGLGWVQKGGGYYSECNKRLKG